jgi:hypothetical protein
MMALCKALAAASNVAGRVIWLMLVVIALAVPSVLAAPPTCPFDIPVVTLPPHQEGGFSWGSVIRPLGDACVASIAVEPSNESAWYAAGQNGLYMTKDGGHSWTKPLSGIAGPLLLVTTPNQLVYVGIANKLYLSRDNGTTWTDIRTFGTTVRSLLVNGSTLYVGLAWSTHAVPSGVWVSNLGAGLAQFHPFGPGQTGLIVWTLARDPSSGMIYAGTEIFDHPMPYKPPFFRSPNGGTTWANVTGILPWHVIASAVRPADGHVYALTEGNGLYGSADHGTTWQPPTLSPGLGNSLLMDPKKPTRLFAGRVKYSTVNGGFFVSADAGKIFKPAGLAGVTVSGLALNGAATRIYAATYGSGIYVSPVPAP